MTATLERWQAVLDQIESGADLCIARFIRGDGVVSLPATELPNDLGTLPVELASRARDVLARVREAESLLARIPRPGIVPRPSRFNARSHAGSTFAHDA